MNLNIINSIKSVFNIEKGSDSVSAIEQIRGETILKGPNLFYLICSAILASVGLDTNSPAVIIGAMLISPLMSPILEIGLSLGTHDKENFFVSVKEFVISVVISLLISTLYFSLSPLGNLTPEILARIKPTALDILIAFFGGIAGIIALTRSKMAAVIPGVAIATALMPPICTAGYGLAAAQYEYFFGAIYLFFINTVFISFASYLIVRYLKFPFKQYLDSKRQLKTKIAIGVFVTLVAIPSFIIFYSVIKDVKANQNIEKFVKEEIQQKDLKVIEWKFIPQKDKFNILNVYVVGSKMTEGRKDSLNKSIGGFGIENTKISFTQLSDDKGIEYIKGELSSDILAKIKLIRKSETEVEDDSLKNIFKQDSIKFFNISNDLNIFMPEIEKVGFSQNYMKSSALSDSINFKRIPIFTVQWKKNISNAKINSLRLDLYKYFKSKVSADTIEILNLK
jgi:uncharacterized hydrophobic protein (TIGR00271 family)